MRYFMSLSYRGAPYCGWQVQPGVPTVQGCIEQALGTLLRRQVGVTGAGRTDTGVNARLMVAHFDSDEPLPADLAFRLNALLGADIAVHGIRPVADTAHARFDAVERTYRYFAVTEKSPFLYPLSWKAPATLDFEAMNRAAAHLLGRQDFTSFSKLHTQVKTNICDVRRAQWVQQAPELWYFEIAADRFLRNMVRAVVGTLVEVGRGKIAPDDVPAIIARRDRCAAGTSMPAQALFLWDVKYPAD